MSLAPARLRARSPQALASAVALASLAALCACGDGARGPGYLGEPLVTRRCAVHFDDPQLADTPLRVGVAWIADDGGARHADDTPLEASLGGTVDVHVVSPPTSDLVLAWPDTTGGLAVGQIVVWRDDDGDERFDPEVDPVVGTDADEVIVWAPLGAVVSGVGTLAAGYHTLNTYGCTADGRHGFSAQAADDGCDLYVLPKFAAPFPRACAPLEPGPCDDLAALRARCAEAPDDPPCQKCAAGLFPMGATPEECDAWQRRCEESFDPAQCASEAAICRG